MDDFGSTRFLCSLTPTRPSLPCADWVGPAGSDAGGDLLADAACQDQRRARALRRGVEAVHLHPHRPDLRGVTASFATAADVILAEPGARIGFAGSRVIEGATKEKLPEGFQTAEFQREHGMVDRIVHRLSLKEDVERLLELVV